MPTVLVISARGGSGASLLASNLGVAVAEASSCMLLDLHGAEAVDDLLLDLEPAHQWPDLIDLSESLSEAHLARAACLHPSGLRLLAGGACTDEAPAQASPLVRSLASHAAWLLIDAPSARPGNALLEAADLTLLVVTTDPVSLRAARRWLSSLRAPARRKVALVVNQVAPGLPLLAQGAGHALEIPLWAWLPADAAAVGRQVHFGEAAVCMRGSPYGRAVRRLALRLLGFRWQQARATEAGQAAATAGESPA